MFLVNTTRNNSSQTYSLFVEGQSVLVRDELGSCRLLRYHLSTGHILCFSHWCLNMTRHWLSPRSPSFPSPPLCVISRWYRYFSACLFGSPGPGPMPRMSRVNWDILKEVHHGQVVWPCAGISSGRSSILNPSWWRQWKGSMFCNWMGCIRWRKWGAITFRGICNSWKVSPIIL